MYNLTSNPGQYKEITILDISDYHGQLVPLAEAADNLTSLPPPAPQASNPAFPIGGSTALKAWFDAYRAEAPNGSITVAAGDSVGATPPISAFFGDTPTIEIMNLMGFSADGLGNHNFDKGSAYLRNTLIPLAQFPYLSANVVDANGKTPAEWSPSQVFDTTLVAPSLAWSASQMRTHRRWSPHMRSIRSTSTRACCSFRPRSINCAPRALTPLW